MEQKNLKIDYLLLIVIGLALAFFFFYSFLSYKPALGPAGQLIFNSPDETANYYFSRQFSENSSLSFADPANLVARGLVAPRSMVVKGSKTISATFNGLPLLYGSLTLLQLY